jgi:hypothetical protein
MTVALKGLNIDRK